MGKSVIIKGADFSDVAINPTPIENYTVALTVSPNDGGTVTGAGTYQQGANVEISAVANSGYNFVRWSDGSTQATRTISNISANVSLTALFEAQGGETYTKVLGSDDIAASYEDAYLKPTGTKIVNTDNQTASEASPEGADFILYDLEEYRGKVINISSAGTIRIAILADVETENDKPSSVVFATGFDERINISNTSVEYTIPFDAKYLYVTTKINGQVRTHTATVISTTPIVDITYPHTLDSTEIANTFEDAYLKTTGTKIVNTDNRTAGEASPEGAEFVLYDIEKYRGKILTLSSPNTLRAAILAGIEYSNDLPSAVVFANGYTARETVQSTTKTYSLPDDVKYLYVNTKANGSSISSTAVISEE